MDRAGGRKTAEGLLHMTFISYCCRLLLPEQLISAMTLPLLFTEYERQKKLKPRKAQATNTLYFCL